MYTNIIYISNIVRQKNKGELRLENSLLQNIFFQFLEIWLFYVFQFL